MVKQLEDPPPSEEGMERAWAATSECLAAGVKREMVGMFSSKAPKGVFRVVQ